MTNTVMMSMFERTREIGTLRAIGWRRRRVMAMIFGESLLLGLIGGAIGCVLGAGMVALLGANTAIGYLQGTVTPGLIAAGLITAIGLGPSADSISRGAPQNAAHRSAAISGGAGKESIKKVSRVKSGDNPIAARRRGRTHDHGYQHRAGFNRDAGQHRRRFYQRVQPDDGQHRCGTGGAAEGCQRYSLQRH
jgi:hypothetical protein